MLINNAGYNLFGSVEENTGKQARNLMETSMEGNRLFNACSKGPAIYGQTKLRRLKQESYNRLSLNC